MFEGFDFGVLDDPGFKEDAVREEIIAPIVRKLGYAPSGPQRVERSKALLHPFVMIGSKKQRITIVPDYTLYDDQQPLMVIEAKAPDEPIVRSKHVEQAYSYAIHPDVRCRFYALCNGRQLVVYDVSRIDPIFLIDCKDVPARWKDVEKYLHPRYLKMPVLREFHADFGLMAKQAGIGIDEKILLEGYFLQSLQKSTDDIFVAQSTCNCQGREYLITLDFSLKVLEALLNAIPAPQASQIRHALARHPFAIDLDCKIKVSCGTLLAQLLRGPNEEYIPLEVTDLLKVEYDPAATIGVRDPDAVAAGVPQLRA